MDEREVILNEIAVLENFVSKFLNYKYSNTDIKEIRKQLDELIERLHQIDRRVKWLRINKWT